jgi:hypothetical protein
VCLQAQHTTRLISSYNWYREVRRALWWCCKHSLSHAHTQEAFVLTDTCTQTVTVIFFPQNNQTLLKWKTLKTRSLATEHDKFARLLRPSLSKSQGDTMAPCVICEAIAAKAAKEELLQLQAPALRCLNSVAQCGFLLKKKLFRAFPKSSVFPYQCMRGAYTPSLSLSSHRAY